FFMVIVSVYLISDFSLLSQIFGEETVSLFTEGVTFVTMLWIVAGIGVVGLLWYLLVKAIRIAGRHFKVFSSGSIKLREGSECSKTASCRRAGLSGGGSFLPIPF